MKLIFMGTPDFAVPILEALHEKYEIVLVISQPNKIKKKNTFLDTPVAACAKRLGLPLFQPQKNRGSSCVFENLWCRCFGYSGLWAVCSLKGFIPI